LINDLDERTPEAIPEKVIARYEVIGALSLVCDIEKALKRAIQYVSNDRLSEEL
jgi:hypothetical protein